MTRIVRYSYDGVVRITITSGTPSATFWLMAKHIFSHTPRTRRFRANSETSFWNSQSGRVVEIPRDILHAPSSWNAFQNNSYAAISHARYYSSTTDDLCTSRRAVLWKLFAHFCSKNTLYSYVCINTCRLETSRIRHQFIGEGRGETNGFRFLIMYGFLPRPIVHIIIFL